MYQCVRVNTSRADYSDPVCVQRVLIGDEEAFEVLVHRYQASLSRLIYSFVKDSFLTEDILQEVFIQLYLSLSRIRNYTTLRPWLFRVARNRCLDKLRARVQLLSIAVLQAVEEDDEALSRMTVLDTGFSPEDVAVAHEIHRHVYQAIEKLPPLVGQVVLLRYSEGMSYRQISSTLGIPVATAKTYFYRAKTLLRATLETMHITTTDDSGLTRSSV